MIGSDVYVLKTNWLGKVVSFEKRTLAGFSSYASYSVAQAVIYNKEKDTFYSVDITHIKLKEPKI